MNANADISVEKGADRSWDHIWVLDEKWECQMTSQIFGVSRNDFYKQRDNHDKEGCFLHTVNHGIAKVATPILARHA